MVPDYCNKGHLEKVDQLDYRKMVKSVNQYIPKKWPWIQYSLISTFSISLYLKDMYRNSISQEQVCNSCMLESHILL